MVCGAFRLPTSRITTAVFQAPPRATIRSASGKPSLPAVRQLITRGEGIQCHSPSTIFSDPHTNICNNIRAAKLKPLIVYLHLSSNKRTSALHLHRDLS